MSKLLHTVEHLLQGRFDQYTGLLRIEQRLNLLQVCQLATVETSNQLATKHGVLTRSIILGARIHVSGQCVHIGVLMSDPVVRIVRQHSI